jgi:hypothetical protein
MAKQTDDKVIEELAKWLMEREFEGSNLTVRWETEDERFQDDWRSEAKETIAKLHSLGYEKVDRTTIPNEKELREKIRQIQLTPIPDWAEKHYTPDLVADRCADLTLQAIKLVGYRSPSEIRAIERDAVERVAEIAAKTMICPPDEDNRNCVVDATKEMCVKCWTEYLESELLEQGKLSRICDKCKSRKELRVGSEQFPSEVCTNPKMYPNGEIKTLYIECSPSFTSCEYFGEQDKGR